MFTPKLNFKFTLVMSWLLLSIVSRAQQSAFFVWETDFEHALQTAKKEDKSVLLYFSGSDWCKPCMKMKQEIFNSVSYKSYAAQNLISVLVDFPRYKRNALPNEQIRQNEQLAATYNEKGIFPLAVLLNASGQIIATANYKPGGSLPFLAYLESKIKPKNQSTTHSFAAMGSPFEITIVTSPEVNANELIAKAELEIRRIEKLISSWDHHSQTSKINTNAGLSPVKVDTELYGLIERSIKVSRLTGGAFDISFASINHIYTFDGSTNDMPSEEEVSRSVQLINYKDILLNPLDTSVFLKKVGMKIGFGAIGKGYAANMAKKFLINNGVKNGIVNAGGDLCAWGAPVNGNSWKIGIADPSKEKPFIAYVDLNDLAMVTSGNYERFIFIDNVKYAHIIDPRTGHPVRGLKSVSIVCPDAELADALATAVFVIGAKNGLAFVNQLENVECLIIDDNNKIMLSKNMRLNEE